MRSASAMRPEAGRTITVNSAIWPSRVGSQEVDALQRAVPDPRLEHQPVDAVAVELVGVAEVLEHPEDRAKDRRDDLTPLVGLEHRRAAKDDVLGEKRHGRVHVGALDRSAKRMPPATPAADALAARA